MPSLASFHKVLSPILGFSEAALYERQRALVRAGVLPKASGRGRSSGGAEVSPEAVAWIILALLATDNLSEVVDQTPKVANCKLGKKEAVNSPFKANSTLLKALTSILSQQALAERIGALVVFRKLFNARISYSDRALPEPLFPQDVPHSVIFLATDDDDRPPAILTDATINGFTLSEIAELLAREEWQ